jgi:hypothetical protein
VELSRQQIELGPPLEPKVSRQCNPLVPLALHMGGFCACRASAAAAKSQPCPHDLRRRCLLLRWGCPPLPHLLMCLPLIPLQVVAQLVWGTGHLCRASGYATRPGAQWVASLLGPSGLWPASFQGDALALLLAGLAKLQTAPDRAWMAQAVERSAEEMAAMSPRVGHGAAPGAPAALGFLGALQPVICWRRTTAAWLLLRHAHRFVPCSRHGQLDSWLSCWSVA